MRTLDRLKIVLALVLFGGVILLPIIVLLVGWSQDNFRTGATAAVITFAVLLVLVTVLIVTVRRHNWFSASLPVLLGAVYSLLPDIILGPADDAVVLSGGAVMSFILWLRKQPGIPKWILLPVIGSIAYTWLGGIIPGPIDELLVYLIAGGTTLYGLRRPKLEEPGSHPAPDFIEGDYIEVEDKR
ncbi:MAG TPA: hypothetical protein VFF68_06825 [Anaerolineaceae bacterium]|nr:hypothetical protein [Anaerolineaceae bacterium]